MPAASEGDILRPWRHRDNMPSEVMHESDESVAVGTPGALAPRPAAEPTSEVPLGALPWVIPGLGVLLLLVTGFIWSTVL
jgi:hypothetical protein